jgi:hypothetical protein
MKILFYSFIIFFWSSNCFTQVVLNANGIGTTYEEINSFFAPGYTAVESPDQLPNGSHSTFGRHIDEVFDASANKFVFRFLSHKNEDNDVSTTSTDRQRVEIKAYASSPDNMKGTIGETVNYKWRFKIPTGFQPSSNFTHIHQIKAVDGDDGDPIFTITVRKGTPNRVELRFDESASSTAYNLISANLSLFEDQWVEVEETIFVHPTTGSYSITIKRLSDNSTLLSYNNPTILTIRSDNSFIRPKWGIYRSTTNSQDLRDEELFFSDFSVTEGILSTENFSNKNIILKSTIVNDSLEFECSESKAIEFSLYAINGSFIKKFKVKGIQKIDVSNLSSGIYLLKSKEIQTIQFVKE